VNAEAVNGDMLSNLMQSLSQGGEGAGMEALMETMMQQLLAKEVLYEPMKEMDTLVRNSTNFERKKENQFFKMMKILNENLPDFFFFFKKKKKNLWKYGGIR